ncbi:hypothetical protein EDD16DRAFT_1635554 [Pisolithus croceorrhizus]|nr:hypothetical protein EDD16DRAFT_1635554 [Pisolithus croceorrhizus]KAI6113301.1 hypothetical protein EV401DRAFT_1984459 [Pisolithus croceorrhizus]
MSSPAVLRTTWLALYHGFSHIFWRFVRLVTEAWFAALAQGSFFPSRLLRVAPSRIHLLHALHSYPRPFSFDDLAWLRMLLCRFFGLLRLSELVWSSLLYPSETAVAIRATRSNCLSPQCLDPGTTTGASQLLYASYG